ncbi:uncharacterized protein MONOS_6352 [Monocercomonoides exilis]|uniref:uncharacterized protein n=1 Tax=Monocercomonoides exilis TaxID=2049356 RepID=UPI003559A8A9|nr:hypothetical protein MONOS_6352 [Monocercomonoides exilis]|eukprot:MONOS_6352.1-p1 / transcript=MONOS_6352.1 / gene=MONOS_6352 / organism=Monocercomonoides_exilis_PA203 / gene_product=unspecified product / transcript_product=unspecified product / location=Mono_scaffold00199:16287-16594(+) / protein_length=81 / sequence_SO=supercontig / SO=protein_coding / is_pseudo=false
MEVRAYISQQEEGGEHKETELFLMKVEQGSNYMESSSKVKEIKKEVDEKLTEYLEQNSVKEKEEKETEKKQKLGTPKGIA